MRTAAQEGIAQMERGNTPPETPQPDGTATGTGTATDLGLDSDSPEPFPDDRVRRATTDRIDQDALDRARRAQPSPAPPDSADPD